MPVSNLQSYRSAAVRVHTTAFAAGGRAMMLEQSLTDKLRRQCGFESVGPVNQAKADIVIDLSITSLTRGGSGIIANSNLVQMDSLLVLTDGETKELMGTSRIRGQSSGMIINNSNPDVEVVEVVSKAIADMLARSGCAGPRIARVTPPPPPPVNSGSAGSGSVTPPPFDETRRAEAEALNDQGKDKLYAADMQGALASFQQAVQLIPDARYQYNVCLAYAAMEQWENAKTSCRKAKVMNPQPTLAARIDERLSAMLAR